MLIMTVIMIVNEVMVMIISEFATLIMTVIMIVNDFATMIMTVIMIVNKVATMVMTHDH